MQHKLMRDFLKWGGVLINLIICVSVGVAFFFFEVPFSMFIIKKFIEIGDLIEVSILRRLNYDESKS